MDLFLVLSMSSLTRIKLQHKGENVQVDVLLYSAVCTKCSPAELTRGIVVKNNLSFRFRIQITRVYSGLQEALLSRHMSWPMTQIICHLLHSLHVTMD